MSLKNKSVKKSVRLRLSCYSLCILTSLNCTLTSRSIAAVADESIHTQPNVFKRLNFLKPEAVQNPQQVKFQQLSNFQYDQTADANLSYDEQYPQSLNFVTAVQRALKRHPEISQRLAVLGSQNANIDIAKSQYFPQISAGMGTGDLGSSQRGRQIFQISAKQMLYDFGQVKSSVNTERAKLLVEQAYVLVSIDDIALQTSDAMINIEHNRKNIEISNQQIAGIQRILDIAKLRANAGISSQADPIQAESYLQSAQANLIAQQSLFEQHQQQLSLLLGLNSSAYQWEIPELLITASDLYADPEFNTIPLMMAVHAEVSVAQLQKKQIDLSRYPSIALKATASQAINGINPSNNKDNGFDQSIMLEAESNLYQGGATASRSRSASYAEQAALAKVNATQLDINEKIRTTRQNIENKQRQMQVLAARQSTTVRTRELYQEQYKLGTRSLLDLLNAEIGIHTAVSELENARYDIYSSLAQYIATTGKSRHAYQLENLSIQGFEVLP